MVHANGFDLQMPVISSPGHLGVVSQNSPSAQSKSLEHTPPSSAHADPNPNIITTKVALTKVVVETIKHFKVTPSFGLLSSRQPHRVLTFLPYSLFRRSLLRYRLALFYRDTRRKVQAYR